MGVLSPRFFKKLLVIILLLVSIACLWASVSWFYIRVIFIAPSAQAFEFVYDSLSSPLKYIFETKDYGDKVIDFPLLTVIQDKFNDDDSFGLDFRCSYKYFCSIKFWKAENYEFLNMYFDDLETEDLYWDLYPVIRRYTYKDDDLLFYHKLIDCLWNEDDLRFSYQTIAVIPQKGVLVIIGGYNYDANTVLPLIIKLIYGDYVKIVPKEVEIWDVI